MKIEGTTANVFIIESLRNSDKENGRCEGKFLSHILKQTGTKRLYRYVQTRKEFEDALTEFTNSGFRYLHISCHGSKRGISLTKERLEITLLARLLRPHLKKRRIFFSSCKIITGDLAEMLLKDTKCYSVIGPFTNIGFDEAAIFWASLYHVMLRDEATGMKFKELRKQVAIFSELYRVKIRYYRSSFQCGFKKVIVPTISVNRNW